MIERDAEIEKSQRGSMVDQMKMRIESKNDAADKRNWKILTMFLKALYFLCNHKIAHFTNFEGQLELLVETANNKWKELLEDAQGNDNYFSNQIIEEFMISISNWIETNLMADKSTDISTVKEMSVLCMVCQWER